ncbi:hypothetical protein HY479_03215 [Candidatus Uhrbacteria bacterium]|nr:hypothetical protein [Candidatus Uhrbacteria bacterium]
MSKKPPYGALLAKLSFAERSELHAWIRWMDKTDPIASVAWEMLKECLATVEEFHELLARGRNLNHLRATEARLGYLRTLSGPPNTPTSTHD